VLEIPIEVLTKLISLLFIRCFLFRLARKLEISQKIERDQIEKINVNLPNLRVELSRLTSGAHLFALGSLRWACSLHSATPCSQKACSDLIWRHFSGIQALLLSSLSFGCHLERPNRASRRCGPQLGANSRCRPCYHFLRREFDSHEAKRRHC